MNLTIKDDSEFLKLVNENYQVFLFSSKCPFPFSFAKHNWFVINQRGKLKRWEVFNTKNKYVKFGYLRNYEKGFSKALNKYLWKKEPHWKESQIERIIEGNKAKDLTQVLENSATNYPFKNKYVLYPGPNSNTFVQWVIDKFPELDFELSWNSFGKNYEN